MADEGNKKRSAQRQINKDDREDDDIDQDDGNGSWQKADNETLSKRRIVKVRRTASAVESSNVVVAPKSNINWGSFNVGPASEPIPPVFSVPKPTSNEGESTKEETPNKVETPKKEATPTKGTPPAVSIFASSIFGSKEEKPNGTPETYQPATPPKESAEKPLFSIPDFKFSTPIPPPNLFSSSITNSPFPPFTGFTAAPGGFATTSLFSPVYIPSSFSSPNIFGKDIAAPKPREEGEEDGDDAGPEEEVPIEPIAGKKLTKVTVTTGEEEEDTIFKATAKLFAFDAKATGWKERGIGQIKVNQAKNNPSQARLIMRDLGGKQIRLNVAIFPAMIVEQAQKPTNITVQAVEKGADGKMATNTYLLRLNNVDEANALVANIDKMKEATKAAANTPVKDAEKNQEETPEDEVKEIQPEGKEAKAEEKETIVEADTKE